MSRRIAPRPAGIPAPRPVPAGRLFLAGFLGVLMLAAGPPGQGNRKLNGPLALTIGGDVAADHAISPDGARVVFRANPDEALVFALYSAPLDGSAGAIRLDAGLAGGGTVEDGYRITPDGARVVYRADHDALGVQELYSVPIDVSAAPVKVSGTLVAGGDVRAGFRISPDGTRVVFTADLLTDERFLLLAAPIDGGAAPSVLNGPLVPGGDVEPDLANGSDGLFVVYSADQDASNVVELYRVPLDGGASPVKLSGALVAGGDVRPGFRISPEGTRVVYTADQDLDQCFELYRARLDAFPDPVKLNPALSGARDVARFEISPDGQRVVYLADQALDTKVELYSVPIDAGTGAVQLNAPMGDHADVGLPFGKPFEISPDGARVVYVADQEVDDRTEIYSVPIDASASPVKLNGPLVQDGTVHPRFEIDSSGSRVVYLAAQDVFNRSELFSVPIDASTSAVKLNEALFPFGNVSSSFRITPDGSRVVYVHDQDAALVGNLYSVPVDASSAPLQLNDSLVPGGDVFVDPDGDSAFSISPDGARVVYLADQEQDEVRELFGAPVDASASSVKLNQLFPTSFPTGDVLAFETAGPRCVYVADQDERLVFELYSSRQDGAGAPVKLSGPMVAGGGVSNPFPFQVSPDGARVVYRADQDVDEVFELFSVPADGSAGPVELNGALVGYGDVAFEYRISADGARVVYRADQDANDVFELYSVPIDARARSSSAAARSRAASRRTSSSATTARSSSTAPTRKPAGASTSTAWRSTAAPPRSSSAGPSSPAATYRRSRSARAARASCTAPISSWTGRTSSSAPAAARSRSRSAARWARTVTWWNSRSPRTGRASSTAPTRRSTAASSSSAFRSTAARPRSS